MIPWLAGFRVGLREMAEASQDACIAVDTEMRVICSNPAADLYYGISKTDDDISKNDEGTQGVFPFDFDGVEYELCQKCLAEGGRHGPREWTISIPGFPDRHVVGVVSAITDRRDEILGVTLVVQDQTQLRATQLAVVSLESQAVDRSVILETASRVALDILTSNTGVEALRHIADAARKLAQARYAALGVARADGKGLIEFVTVGLTPAEEAVIGPRPIGAGILGLLLQRDAPLRIDRLASHSASSGFPPNHPPMDSFLGVPIKRGNTVLGSLYLTNKIGAERFSEADELAVQALGAHAAVAIHNLQLLSRQRSLVTGLINAQEEERRSVAYDLHDGLTQYVMASHIHMEASLMAAEESDQAGAAKEFAKGLRYLNEAVVESRRLVSGLRSLALDDLGLAGAMEQLFGEEKERANWDDAEFIHNLAGRRFERNLETTIYRVAQEALTNVRKHSGAKRVRLLLLSEDDEVFGERMLLEARDWGVGLNEASRTQDDNIHVGLQGMAERASLVGGTFELHSVPGEGTTIRAVFPAHLQGDVAAE